VLPTLAVGEKCTAAALSPANPKSAERFTATMDALGTDDPRDTPAMAAVCATYRAARTTDNAFGPIKPPGKDHNSLAGQLALLASAIKARVPTRVYSVQLGGFDTHTNERGTLQRLQMFDETVTPFLQEMAATAAGKDVVLVAYSEFGRQVKANASQGTDHGTAGPVFVAGTAVTGGFYGEEPSLTNLDNGDLRGTTDFRRLVRVACANVADRSDAVGRRRSAQAGVSCLARLPAAAARHGVGGAELRLVPRTFGTRCPSGVRANSRSGRGADLTSAYTCIVDSSAKRMGLTHPDA
jgi:uncharacterized protein (DUF1501 family)